MARSRRQIGSRELSGSFTRLVVNAGVWSSLRIGATQFIGLFVFFILARFFLGENDFGAVALANTLLGLSQIIARLGIATALIQRADITDGHRNAVFWSSVALAAAIAAAFFLIAPTLGYWLGEPLIIPLIRALAPGVLITLLAATHEALLSRELSFKILALRSLIASLAGGCFALLAAISGWGVWSLVVLNLVTAAVNLIFAWRAHPWRPSLSFDIASFRQLFATGARVTSIGVVVFLYRHADNLILGSLVGLSQLGLYYFGKRILNAILELLGQSINAVALPSFSRLSNDLDRVRRGFLRLTSVVAAFAFPILLGLATLADPIVLTVFGEKWAAASPVLRWLCIGGIPQALTYFASPILIALGHASAAFKATCVATIIMLTGASVGALFGAKGVAIGFAFANALVLIYYGRIFLRIIELPAKMYMLATMPALASATTMVVLVSITDAFLKTIGVGGSFLLLLTILAGISSYVFILKITDPHLYRFLIENIVAFAKKH